VVNCGTLELLIRQAYVTYANGTVNFTSTVPIEGGPGWINSDHYEINAKAEDGASRELMSGPMMQALLEDRFKLKLHHETRETPVYSVTVAKTGLKLHQLEDGGCTPLDFTKPFESPAPDQKPICITELSIRRKQAKMDRRLQ
jgi:uncharacterized protein (TIGR03435 family)